MSKVEEKMKKIATAYMKAVGNNPTVPCSGVSFGGGSAMFSFVNIPIEDCYPNEVLICLAKFSHISGTDFNIIFTRPSVSSSSFNAYPIPSITITDDNILKIFSDGACRWYSQFGKLPAGFSFQRLHPSCRTLDVSMFGEDYILKDNCKFLSQPMQALMFGDISKLKYDNCGV